MATSAALNAPITASITLRWNNFETRYIHEPGFPANLSKPVQKTLGRHVTNNLVVIVNEIKNYAREFDFFSPFGAPWSCRM